MKRVPVILAILIVLVFCNYHIGLFLVGLRPHTDAFKQIRRTMPPVQEPLAFAYHWGPNKTAYNHFLAGVGLAQADAEKLPDKHALFVDISWVMKANPYPPVLWELLDREGEEEDAPRSAFGYFSYGYMAADGKYHQVTYYQGEADSTPSVLVSKTRGGTTYWGDYFVQYVVYLSKRTTRRPLVVDPATGQVDQWDPPPKYPNIDRIDWSTFEGGSYNGFEELGFAIVATVAETILLIAALYVCGRSRQTADTDTINGDAP